MTLQLTSMQFDAVESTFIPLTVAAELASLAQECAPRDERGHFGWSEATVIEVKNVGSISSHNIRIELKC